MSSKGRENYQTGQKKANYFSNRYLIFSLKTFAFLALAPSCMWLCGLEIRQFGFPKIQGDVCISLFPVCAVFQVLIPLLFVLVPSHCLQGTSSPYPAPMATSLCSNSSGSVSSSLPSAATFCNLEVPWFSVTTFLSSIYQATCVCSKTSAVNILILYVMLLQPKWMQVCFLSSPNLLWTIHFYAWLSERRKNYNYVKHCPPLPLIHGRSRINWIETANILKCKLD